MRVCVALEAFKDFLEDDFDIKSFSANVLQTKIVTDYLQHLSELIRTLDGEIKQQVTFASSVAIGAFRKRNLRLGIDECARSLSASIVDWDAGRRSGEYADAHQVLEDHSRQVRVRYE